MSRKLRAVFFALLGLAGLATAATVPEWQLPSLGAGLVFLFLAGTALSNATQIARALQNLVTESVLVEVWGTSLPAANDGALEVVSIQGVGAGLLIRLRVTKGGTPILLKVAQPRSLTLEKDRAEIGEAAYVSWAGVKLWPVSGTRGAALVLHTERR